MVGFRLGNVDGHAVLVDGDHCFDLDTDPLTALADPPAVHAEAARLGDREPDARLADVSLGPPVPAPRNVFGIGLNYRAHIEETGSETPDVPVVFTKYPTCIAGPDATIDLRGQSVDYEAELVVVIGRGGRDLTEAEAWAAVAGVTAGQDISDRELQYAARPPQFGLGKSRDGYGPIGPVIVSPDLLADRDAVPIECRINGDLRQQDDTSSMILSVPELVAYLSGILTLQPGDLIFTGTPDGVGVATGRFLGAGDTIETTLGGVGSITTRCA